MYINAVANGVMLQFYLRSDFYKTVFKIKHKLHRASGSAPPPQIKKMNVDLRTIIISFMQTKSPFRDFVPISSVWAILKNDTEMNYPDTILCFEL